MDITLIKLGGSLLTDKTRPRQARFDVIERLARELAQALSHRDPGRAVVLGHGSGSFGHVEAQRCGLGIEAPKVGGEELALAIAATQAAAASLHRHLLDALLDASVPAFSLPPSALWTTDAGQVPAAAKIEPVLQALDLGLLPVLYGDVVLDTVWGGSIRSTEHVLTALLDPLQRAGHRIERALWLGETSGLLDEEGQGIPTVHVAELPALRRRLEAPRGTDVTGGMDLRLRTVQELAERGVPSLLLDGRQPGLLARCLEGSTLQAHEGTVISL